MLFLIRIKSETSLQEQLKADADAVLAIAKKQSLVFLLMISPRLRKKLYTKCWKVQLAGL